MDAILETPMADLLANVPVDQETKTALLTGAGPLGPLYQLMLARESGEWQNTDELASQLKLSETEMMAMQHTRIPLSPRGRGLQSEALTLHISG